MFFVLETQYMQLDDPDLEFRPCCPDDAEAMIPLIYSSGPETFRYVFSDREQDQALRFIEFAFKTDRGELGFNNHIALTHQGRVVASGAIWTREKNGPFMRAVISQIFQFYGIVSGTKVIRRGLLTERIIKPPQANTTYIAHIGVSPESRGKGLGTRLIEHLLDEARRQGSTIASLDVACANHRAQSLYEKLGFTVKEPRPASRSTRFGRLLDHNYMELDLT